MINFPKNGQNGQCNLCNVRVLLNFNPSKSKALFYIKTKYKELKDIIVALSDTEGNAVVKASILRLCDTGSVYSTVGGHYASTA